MTKEAAVKPAADEAKNPAAATPAAPAKPVATAAAVEKASTKPGTQGKTRYVSSAYAPPRPACALS